MFYLLSGAPVTDYLLAKDGERNQAKFRCLIDLLMAWCVWGATFVHIDLLGASWAFCVLLFYIFRKSKFIALRLLTKKL